MTDVRWLAGAERVTGGHTGGTVVDGPPRVCHHITWDALGPGGAQPAFGDVRDFLVRAGFEPHLMIDPFTGRIAQFIPLDRSAYGLEHRRGTCETNRQGHCIQIEWFFTPGCVRNGKRYATLADTPMAGWDTVLGIAAHYGVPAVWPLGIPDWHRQDGAAAEQTWLAKAGHYGHSQVPHNAHTDPGPLRAFPTVAPKVTPAKPVDTLPAWWHRTLAPGMRDDQRGDVSALQKALGMTLRTGYFGRTTTRKVRAFQAAHHLTQDAVVGRITAAALARKAK